jgi:hypothetical protein
LEFVNGPQDGSALCSDTSETQAVQLRLFALLVRSYLIHLEREERRPDTLAKYRLPFPSDVGRAQREGWTDAQRRALMRSHEYEVTDHHVAGTAVLMTARYMGTF